MLSLQFIFNYSVSTLTCVDTHQRCYKAVINAKSPVGLCELETDEVQWASTTRPTLQYSAAVQCSRSSAINLTHVSVVELLAPTLLSCQGMTARQTKSCTQQWATTTIHTYRSPSTCKHSTMDTHVECKIYLCSIHRYTQNIINSLRQPLAVCVYTLEWNVSYSLVCFILKWVEGLNSTGSGRLPCRGASTSKSCMCVWLWAFWVGGTGSSEWWAGRGGVKKYGCRRAWGGEGRMAHIHTHVRTHTHTYGHF